MRFLVTGHTGFKGSWLCLVLKTLGHEVHGIALNPPKNGIFELANVGEMCCSDVRLDIRNKEALDAEVVRIQPEAIFHLAAQPLVLESFERPYDTYSTNVGGTLNLLAASSNCDSLRGIVNVTSDKVYLNQGLDKSFVETDFLGGTDPYSSSKALADLLSQRWADEIPNVPMGIARAGNVIGGGDVHRTRLIPDIFHSVEKGSDLVIRNPKATRPWQHVLDCLSGYLLLMDYVLSGHSGTFNFGPEANEKHEVDMLVRTVFEYLGQSIETKTVDYSNHEAQILSVDSGKARSTLGWCTKLSFRESVEMTTSWWQAMVRGENMRKFSENQLMKFNSIAV